MTAINVFECIDCPELIDAALKQGFDINSVDLNGNTLLHLAIHMGYYDTVELLVANEAYELIRNNELAFPHDIALNQPCSSPVIINHRLRCYFIKHV